MRRLLFGGNEAFQEATDSYVKDFEARVKSRRKEMDEKWKEIEAGWTSVEQRMREVGVKSAEREDSMLRLNVGGALTDLWRSSLAEHPGFRNSRLLKLFEGVWDKRLPKLSDGRIFLDESPSCFKHLMEMQLNSEQETEVFPPEAFEPHDEPYLEHVVDVFQLEKFTVNGMIWRGGSTVLGGDKSISMSQVLHRWLSGIWVSPSSVDLLYRASEDGFSARAFHARCDEAPSTLTLVRVRAMGASRHSILGGYSNTPWTAPAGPEVKHNQDKDAFIFLLKDGVDGAPAEKWSVRLIQRNNFPYDTICSSQFGPCFGNSSLKVRFNIRYQSGRVSSAVSVKASGLGSSASANAFLDLDNAKIVELEVYSQLALSMVLSRPQGHPSVPPSPDPADAVDRRLLGETIAACLMRERRALKAARAELRSAKRKVEAAAEALKTVYGPQVAAGIEDTVLELNVRGKRMVTLRSTLRACPESALAARFDEDKWLPQEQDLDESGRYVVDCCSMCFGKVLDVLRIRKRTEWSRGPVEDNPATSSDATSSDEGDRGPVEDNPATSSDATSSDEGDTKPKDKKMVLVPQEHRDCFDTLVDMYFPGCKDFIMRIAYFDLTAEL